MFSYFGLRTLYRSHVIGCAALMQLSSNRRLKLKAEAYQTHTTHTHTLKTGPSRWCLRFARSLFFFIHFINGIFLQPKPRRQLNSPAEKRAFCVQSSIELLFLVITCDKSAVTVKSFRVLRTLVSISRHTTHTHTYRTL